MTECLVCNKNFSRSTGVSKHLETEAHKRKASLDDGGQSGGNSLMDFDIEDVGDDNDGDDNQGDDDDDGGDESEDDYATRLEATLRLNYALCGQQVQIRILLDAEHPIRLIGSGGIA